MSKQVAVIGLEPLELRWVKTLILLLRHPDPGTPALTREALLYLLRSADERDANWQIRGEYGKK